MTNSQSSGKLRHRMKPSRLTRLGRSNYQDKKPDYERVKLLFDYTKFHIGVYISLGSAIVAVLGLKKSYHLEVATIPLVVGVIFIMFAGFAGGTIVSRLTQVLSYDDFWIVKTGPGNAKLLTGEEWTYVEHVSFWTGLIWVFFAFVSPLINF